MHDVIGWDIGGVHTKAVRLRGRDLGSTRAVSRSFEIWHDRDRLSATLAGVLEQLGSEEVDAMAVTMTAELSDAFRTKREGVRFIAKAVESAFPHIPVYFLSLDGDFLPLGSVYEHPLDFAAANWLASGLFVASQLPNCILIDVGSTTTDIIPILRRSMVNVGRTDTERLESGELVYTGAVRTNPNTIAPCVPIEGRFCRLAAEHFTLMGDVYLLLGFLSPEDYTTPTPDGREKSPEAVQQRLARLVCADRESLGEEQVRLLARYLHEKQLQQIGEALLQVLSRVQGGRQLPLATVGVGRFLAAEVGRRMDVPVIDLEKRLGKPATAVFPSVAAAYLLSQYLDGIQQ